jgi:hypothetical protein
LGRAVPDLEPTAYCDEIPVLAQSPSSRAFGYAFTPMGDLDGDGCDEFAVSGFGSSGGRRNGPEHSGSVRVMWGWGGPGCPAAPQVTTMVAELAYRGGSHTQSRLMLAADISGGLDIDGDEIPDLVSSALGYETFNGRNGAVWLTSGAYILGLPRQDLDNGNLPPEANTIYSALIATGGPLPLSGFTVDDNFGNKLSLVPSEDGLEAVWLGVQAPGRDAGGGALSGAVEFYAFDRARMEWNPTPRVVISGDSADAGSGIGASMDFAWRDDQLWVLAGIPKSDARAIDDGAAIAAPLQPDCKIWFRDTDGDGYGDHGDPGTPCAPANMTDVGNNRDCDDDAPNTHPGAAEIEEDGVDQDCDGADALAADPLAVDDDGDGFSEAQGDCDDTDPGTSPIAYDIPEDGVDQDCDGEEGTAPTFGADVVPLMRRYRCNDCHAAWHADYAQVLSRVNLADPPNSALYLKIDGDTENQVGVPMPKNDANLAAVSVADAGMILYWISSGAPEN